MGMNSDRPPLRLLSAAFLLTFVIFSVFGYFSWNSYKDVKESMENSLRIVELKGSILLYDEVLTMSAKMASLSGDIYWEKRYEKFEPELDLAIKQLISISPESFIGESAEKTDTANIKLVAMENQAFKAVRKGNLDKAKALLDSEAYQREKEIYTAGMRQIKKNIEVQTDELIKKQLRQIFLLILSLIVTLPLLIITWIVTYRKFLFYIDKRKQAEEKLAAEKERLAVTLRSIGDGVITTDIEGKIVFINKVAEQLTGWSNEDARGKLSHEVFNIINEKTGQKCASPVSRVLELGRIVGLANHTALIAKNGTQVSIADSGAPIRDAETKIIGVVIVFRDVTHERRIEEELLKTRKLESVGILAGGIAHDFNNILDAVLGNIELASLRVEDDEATSLLSSAQKATKRATKLTQQLLTFSKGGDPVKEKTSLSGLIQESADFVLHGSNVGCEYNQPDDLWMVDADSGQLGQVIQNIIINAKQAMPEGGKIQINCSNIEDAATESLLNIHDGNFVCIRIQDTGIGIPKEIIDKIFDPYYSTKQQGSGLGLSICHSIINKHDGHISVQSSPGKGTTFTIYLPAVSPGETTAPKVLHTGSAVKAARIMVMDDEEMIRNLVKAQLTRLGHEAVLVVDGEQAINEYQKLQDSGTPVDLVIMDLTIPGGMGGQEAAKRLLRVDSRAKIIVASGYSNDPVMAGYREYGFCAAIAKPFQLQDLSQVLSKVLA